MTGLSADTVVVPIDFSDQSFAAIDTALEIVGDPAKLHVLHVLPDLNPAEPGVVWNTIDNENRTKHATDAIRERLADSKYDPLQVHIEIGDPGHRVSAYAEKVNADLIVTPSHGRTGLKRLLIGSVAERIVRLATCPVLVLRN